MERMKACTSVKCQITNFINKENLYKAIAIKDYLAFIGIRKKHTDQCNQFWSVEIAPCFPSLSVTWSCLSSYLLSGLKLEAVLLPPRPKF